MPFTHHITRTYATGAGTVLNVTENITGTNQGVDIDTSIAPEATIAYDVMIVPDNVQSMMIYSDQPAEIKTNDQNTPTDTLPLKGGVPVTWTINSAWPIPFQLGTSVIKLFITNHGAVDGNVKIRVLSN